MDSSVPAAAPRSPASRVAKGCLGLAVLLALAATAAGFVVYRRSERHYASVARDLHVTPTPERLARGRYLASVSCELCHGKDGALGREFTLPVVHSWAANISQDRATGTGSLTDGELEEALRRGVSRGRRLRPPMPLLENVSDEDAAALIVWMRSLPAVSKPSRPPELPALGRFVFAMAADPASAVPAGIAPPAPEKVGEYLANEISRCADCHHPRERNVPIPGRLWSGGFRLEEPGLPPVLSSNITPDPVEGIGKWTKEELVRTLRTGTNAAGRALHGAMPRYPLTDSDAGAIFDYLRAQPPVRVHVWSPGAVLGSELYVRYGCVSCHGLDGKGPRADITRVGAEADVKKIETWIKDPGAVKPGTMMPKLGIEDPRELESLARFVVELAKHQGS